MSLSPPRLLPWRSWQEWLYVYSELEAFLSAPVPSGGAAARLPPGLSFFAACCQARGRAPLAVSSTFTLLQLLRESAAAPRVCDAALGLALIRLVNGVADSGQTGAYAASIAEIARRAGLPRWLVDLRHDLTHGVAPEGRVLRLAASQALCWLLGHYWRPQAAALTLHLGYEEAPAIAALLEAYCAAATADAPREQQQQQQAQQPHGSGKAAGKRGRGHQQQAVQPPSAAAASGAGPRLLLFSPTLLRDVQLACDGHYDRLLLPDYQAHALLKGHRLS
jgi:hypothetical protein